MYYVEGDPRKSVSPDVLVSFGLGKKPRRTYLVWEEGKVPDFVMEFSSKNTYRNDLGHKMELSTLHSEYRTIFCMMRRGYIYHLPLWVLN